MSVFRSIVFSAVVSGLITGAAVTAVQQFGTVPLILKAETYEHDAAEPEAAPAAVAPASQNMAGHDHSTHDHAAHQQAASPPPDAHKHDAHEHDAAAWKPAEGLQRHAFTAAANVLTAIGFALLLAGIYALRGGSVNWHDGLLWGLSGFVVFTMAPGLGLPPELPGVPTASLEPRQAWWIATTFATAAGLGLIFLQRSALAAVLGVCLIAAPHLFGAPQLADVETDVPDALSHRFVVAVTVTSLLFWALLGSLTGMTYSRFSRSSLGGNA
jgi:cobalt transporter subunit CbtA